MTTPALDRQARARYARHLSLPEIGQAGQARLLEARIALAEDEGTEAAALYLERAGVTVERAARYGMSPVHVEPGDPALAEAAAFLSGALTAVEAIKLVLGVGTPMDTENIRLKEPSP